MIFWFIVIAPKELLLNKSEGLGRSVNALWLQKGVPLVQSLSFLAQAQFILRHCEAEAVWAKAKLRCGNLFVLCTVPFLCLCLKSGSTTFNLQITTA
jgi:hypothetical protein